MGALETVVFAEGPAELGPSPVRPFYLPPQPGQRLTRDRLGAAHKIVAKSIATTTDIPERAVEFQQPPRLNGRQVRGSDLYHPDALHQLLEWPEPPNLAVVFVDRDGQKKRREKLHDAIEEMSPTPTRIIAVAVEEFESWMISDITAVQNVLGTFPDLPSEPEEMKPREAKSLLQSWEGSSERSDPAPILRREIADHLDIATLRDRCSSFQTFLTDLAHAGL